MALIGNIKQIEVLLTSQDLKYVFAYFSEAMNKESVVYKRIASLPVGSFEKVQIADKIFALEQVFYTKNREMCFFETHRNYVDFQLVLEGIEQMEHCFADKLEIKHSYDSAKDLIVYHMTDISSKLIMQKGDLAVYDTGDAHMGLGRFKEPCLVYKTVIKVPVEMYIV